MLDITLFFYIVRAYVVLRIIYFTVSNYLNEFIIIVMYFLSCTSNIFYFQASNHKFDKSNQNIFTNL